MISKLVYSQSLSHCSILVITGHPRDFYEASDELAARIERWGKCLVFFYAESRDLPPFREERSNPDIPYRIVPLASCRRSFSRIWRNATVVDVVDLFLYVIGDNADYESAVQDAIAYMRDEPVFNPWAVPSGEYANEFLKSTQRPAFLLRTRNGVRMLSIAVSPEFHDLARSILGLYGVRSRRGLVRSIKALFTKRVDSEFPAFKKED